MIYGNTGSIKKAVLAQMEDMYSVRTGRGDFIAPELAESMAYFTGLFEREIAVYIDRSGTVRHVGIGTDKNADLPDIDGTEARRNEKRLCGIRCFHTHPGGDGKLSEVDCVSLVNMRFDAMTAFGVKKGMLKTAQTAFLAEEDENLPGGYSIQLTQIYRADSIPQAALIYLVNDADKRIRPKTAVSTSAAVKERVILAGMENGCSMDELERLADTAGAETVGRIIQHRSKSDTATYFGTGKVKEMSLERSRLCADTIIVNEELSGVQQRNLEEKTGAKVIDRSTLILDIFAQRAVSYEGKLQVELAQLKYRLPRLAGVGTAMSRLGGGIGTRGPGESKLESDKRHIRARIDDLENKIKELTRQRGIRRRKRDRTGIPIAALVGYTNSGKSTLLNLLSNAGVLAEDKLFATLDPISRRITLPDGTEIMLVDTVGFIDKLPHEFIDAFRSTMEEAAYASVLLHVVDASDPNKTRHMQVVEEVLDSLGAADKPRIIINNKTDLTGKSETDGINVSAKENSGIDELMLVIQERIHGLKHKVNLIVPYTAGKALDFIHRCGSVISENYTQDGTAVTVRISEAEFGEVLSMGAEEIEPQNK